MEISYDTLQAGARLFNVDEDTLQLLGGMDGVVYAYTRGGRQYVLKFTPAKRERVPGMRAKLEFVKYLADHGVTVAGPVRSVKGELIELLDAPKAATEYAVSSSERAPGRLAFETGEWGAELFEEWGRVIGQMHRLTKSYDEQRTWADGLIGSWEGEHYSFEKSCEDDAVRAKWLALGDELRGFTPNRDCFGLIHNDLHPFNFMVSQVNGKLRDRIRVPVAATQAEIEQAALASEKVRAFTADHTVKKIVIVPKKVVNIVLA